MPLWPFILLSAISQIPAAEVVTLKGERQTGELIEVTDANAILKQGDQSTSISLTTILEINFPTSPSVEPIEGAEVTLADGSRLIARKFSVAGEKGRIETAYGNLTIPVAKISAVRFGMSTARLDESWQALLAKESATDLLVVKNEDVLDFLEGVTSDVGDKINILLDGAEAKVARERVFGVVYHRRIPSLAKSVCEVRLGRGDRLEAAQISYAKGEARIRLAAGGDLAIAAEQIAAFDFSISKIKYLSDLKPRDVKYVPFWDLFLYEYRRDLSLDGGPLTLQGKSYPRGLALHSKSTLRYRIGGEFSRLQALTGIDDSVADLGHIVQLVISGDGKILFDGEIKGREPPRPLDLDVVGVRDLEILVDFGSDVSDIGDHLDLVDAKLIR